VPTGSDAVSRFGHAMSAGRDPVSARTDAVHHAGGDGLPPCRDAVPTGSNAVRTRACGGGNGLSANSDPVSDIGCGDGLPGGDYTLPGRGDAVPACPDAVRDHNCGSDGMSYGGDAVPEFRRRDSLSGDGDAVPTGSNAVRTRACGGGNGLSANSNPVSDIGHGDGLPGDGHTVPACGDSMPGNRDPVPDGDRCSRDHLPGGGDALPDR
jgi:hypothetical protein